MSCGWFWRREAVSSLLGEFRIRRVNCEFDWLVIAAVPQHETMLSRETACVIATPQNQIVGLGDNHQFFLLFHRGLRGPNQQQTELQTVTMTDIDFQISPRLRRVRGKGDKW